MRKETLKYHTVYHETRAGEVHRVAPFKWENKRGSRIPSAWEEISYKPLTDTFVLQSASKKVSLTLYQKGFRICADQVRHFAPKYFDMLPVRLVYAGCLSCVYNPTGIGSLLSDGGRVYFAKAIHGSEQKREIDPADAPPIGAASYLARDTVGGTFTYSGGAGPSLNEYGRRDGVASSLYSQHYVGVRNHLATAYYGDSELAVSKHGELLQATEQLHQWCSQTPKVEFSGYIMHGNSDYPAFEVRLILLDKRVEGQRTVVHALCSSSKVGEGHVWLEVLNEDGTIKRDAPAELDAAFRNLGGKEWAKRAIDYMQECAVMDCLPLA